MIITDRGKIIRMRVADISTIGRNTQGVRLISLDAGEKVAGVCRLMEADDAESTDGDEEETNDQIGGEPESDPE